jgi:hypothetical protein
MPRSGITDIDLSDAKGLFGLNTNDLAAADAGDARIQALNKEYLAMNGNVPDDCLNYVYSLSEQKAKPFLVRKGGNKYLQATKYTTAKSINMQFENGLPTKNAVIIGFMSPQVVELEGGMAAVVTTSHAGFFLSSNGMVYHRNNGVFLRDNFGDFMTLLMSANYANVVYFPSGW